MIKNRAVDHIGIAVEDVEKDAKWYQDTLGFTVKGKFFGEGASHPTYFLQNGATVYELYQDDTLAPAAKGKIDHISYQSTDIEADYKYCVDQGYQICTKGVEGCPTFWAHGCKYFKILSPAGEQVEFCQVL